ncbi:hypothetical protein GIB67_009142 [Kingdonia uniflora]|uniref:Uncharacterized protein n=1 Tax=Kingdonia uniflora TaxID=39325 RepID=A0A7J7N273_9MAGN|nr:hypothetical protein GIB67_009142 [Kingdonia uniflora]
MVPYEVDSIIFNLLKTWIDERLKKVKDCEDRAKETETWNLKSKTEPYTQSSVEMLKLAEEAVGDFFEIPIGISDDLFEELADGLESLFQDYISLVSLCGSKQSCNPTLPPLTRCNKDSKFLMLWRKASHCRVGTEESHKGGSADDHHPRPSTSHEDFESLKRVFCSYGEGLVAEEVVDKEAKIVEGVVELMGQPTDQLVEDFSIAAYEASGMGSENFSLQEKVHSLEEKLKDAEFELQKANASPKESPEHSHISELSEMNNALRDSESKTSPEQTNERNVENMSLLVKQLRESDI